MNLTQDIFEIKLDQVKGVFEFVRDHHMTPQKYVNI